MKAISICTIALIFLAALIYWYSKKSKEEKNSLFLNAVEKIKGYVLDLIFEAEKYYQSGTGQFKKAYVISAILNGEFYKGLPSYVQKLISFSVLSDLIDKMVETIFNSAKNSNIDIQQRLSE